MRYSLAILTLLTVSAAPLAACADTVSFSFTTTAGGSFGGSVFGTPITITGSFDSAEVTNNAGAFTAPTTFFFDFEGISTVDSAPGSNFLIVDPGTDTAELVGASGLLLSVESSDFGALTGLTPGFSITGAGSATGTPENFDVVGGGGTVSIAFDAAGDPTTLTVGNPATGPSPVPEPSSLLFLSTGLMGLVGTTRRRFARR